MRVDKKVSFKKFLLTTTSLVCLAFVPLQASFQEAEAPQKRESSARRHGLRLGPRGGQGLLDMSFKPALLTSLQARDDLLTPLLQSLRLHLKAQPEATLKLIKDQFEELLDENRSLLPHTFLHSTDVIRTQPDLSPDHYEFNRLNGILQTLKHLSAEPSLSAVSEFFKQLHDLYQQYQQALCPLLPHERIYFLSAIPVKSDLFEHPMMISKEMAYRLLSMDEYGIITKRNKTGSSPNVELRGTYFKKALFLEREGKKYATLDPGMEWAMGAFHNRLFGEGIAHSAFLVFPWVPYKQPSESAEKARLLLKNINDPAESPQRERRIRRLHEDEELKRQFIDTTSPFSAQASQTITGTLLKDFLLETQKNPQLLETLDTGQVQGLLLSLLLTNPNDAKGDNFIVTNGEKNRKIISIDNDLSLAARIVKVQAPNGGPIIHFPEVRNLLLMLPAFMDQPLLPEVRAQFISQEPTLFLFQWLRALKEQNRRYQALEPYLDSETFALFRLPFHFQPGTLRRLHQEWSRFQQILTTKAETTPQELLESISPLLGTYYQKLRIMDQDYLRSFDRLYPLPQRSLEELLDVEKGLPDDCLVKEALERVRATEGDFKNRTQSVIEAVAELVETFEPFSLSPPSLKAVLEELFLGFPESLREVLLKIPLSRLLPASPSKELLDTLFMLFPERLCEIEDDARFSPLHQALNINNTQLVAYLLKKGASPDQPTKDHRFPLDLACENGAQEAFKRLVDAGASKVNTDRALAFYHKLTSNSPALASFIKLTRRHQELQWLLSIQQLLPERGEGVPIQTASFGNRVFPQTLYDQLFTAKGGIKADNVSGRHAVGHLTIALQNLPLTLYFKAYPELPGLEEAVGEFMRRFLGFGAPYAELVKVGNTPVLVSQGIQGPTLDYILKKSPQILDYLDADALSALFLVTMLVNPEDGKGDNYIVETMPGSKVRLIAIDNDHAFVPAIARPQKKSFSFLRADEPVVQVKSILYCLDQFQAPVSATAREQVLNINTGKMLEGWLRFLRARNALYGDLFNEEERLELLKQESYIGIPFQEGAMTHLYQKIRRLQEALQQNPEITHEKLLKLLEPELAHRYSKGFEKPATVLERFQVIDGPFYGKGASGEPYTFTKSGHILKALNIPLTESLIESASKDSSKTHDYRPNKALQELKAILNQHQQAALNKIGALNAQQLEFMPSKELMQALSQQDFSNIPLGDQRVLFELLRGRRIEEFILKNATALTDKVVSTYPQLDALLSLNVSGCTALTDQLIQPLAEGAPHLIYLNLSGLPKFTHIGKEGWVSYDLITFPALKTLIMNESAAWGIYLNAPSLLHFEARRCAQLKSLQIKGSQLETVLLTDSPQVKAEDLVEVLINHPHLQHLGIENGPKIYFDPALKAPVPKKTLSLYTPEFKAVQFYYRKAVLNKDAVAQTYLAMMYEIGTWVEKNEKLAAQWYRKAAVQGNADAQASLGSMYEHGRGIEKNENKAAYLYNKAAAQGNANAQFDLGKMYEHGKGIEKNEKLALYWFKKAADQGKAHAQFSLGVMYEHGRGVEKDEQLAVEWYSKAAHQGNADAQFNLGLAYDYGRGVEKDEKLAVEWYSKAAHQECCAAQFNLGVSYSKGAGVEKDEKLAFKWYRKAAEQGFTNAQFILGLEYVTGTNVEQNKEIALGWLKKAADQGYSPAQYSLGKAYENDNGVKNDEEIALYWFKKAAEQGHADAQVKLGWMYGTGIGVEQDEKLAVEWYKKAADQGNALAQDSLGVMYANGIGVEKDEQLAVEWYSKAAHQGNADAQFNLGVMYENGSGVEKNEQLAFECYKKTAHQGNAHAQFNLGMMYANGIGVEKDEKLAVDWYRKAADQGNTHAQVNLGLRYMNGQGIKQDYKEAFKCWEKAASQSDARGQTVIGIMYKEGWGVQQNTQEALQWLQKAADQGNALGQYGLALLYRDGEGVAASDVQAIAWLREAANQNNEDAQYTLGWMYENGRGVAKDLEEAAKWYKASERGCPGYAVYSIGRMYEYGFNVEQDLYKALEWYRIAAGEKYARDMFYAALKEKYNQYCHIYNAP